MSAARQEILVVYWEWTEETKHAGARFWGAHSVENDGRISDWPKIGLRPIGAAKVLVKQGEGLDLLTGNIPAFESEHVNEITRFNIDDDEFGSTSMVEADDGVFIFYTDHLAAVKDKTAWQPMATADKDAHRLTLGIVRKGVLEEIHIGGYRYAINDDDVSCWWSDQCDDEIVPTHWLPDLSFSSPPTI